MAPVMHDDASDLPRAKAGEHDAFARLYDRHAPVVMSLCRVLTPEEADDALQETFVRAFDRLDELHGPEFLRSWLYSIAHRVCRERRRASGRRRTHEGAAAMTHADTLPAPPAPGDAAGRDEQLQRLTAAMELLEDSERLALHLYYLDADPVSAAQRTLGVSRSAFYKTVARARQRLTHLMSERATA